LAGGPVRTGRRPGHGGDNHGWALTPNLKDLQRDRCNLRSFRVELYGTHGGGTAG